MIPHLIAVQQDQANGLPPFSGQRIPYIRSLRASAAIQCYVPINGVAGGAGCVAAPRLNTFSVLTLAQKTMPGKGASLTQWGCCTHRLLSLCGRPCVGTVFRSGSV